jgi:PAS domain S-box-containing protein
LAEKALQEGEAKYRFLTEKMNDIIWTADLGFRVTYISPSIEKVLGFTPQERMGQLPNQTMTPKSYTNALYLLSKELMREQEEGIDPGRTIMLELEYYHKNGSLVWMESIVSAIRDERDNLMGIHGVSRDITERKRAEEEKMQLETQLSQAQKMESIGTLAGGIAHDFNNILSAIIGFSELALNDVTDPIKIRREINEVLKAGDRAKDLVRQILTFSRKTDATYSPIILNTIITDSIKMMRSVLPSTIEIRQSLINKGLVMADPTQIHQVMMNLCTNAAHAMDKSGGVLEVRLEKVNVDEGAHALKLNLPPGPYLRLLVSDTGHGMTPEVMARMFDPYFTTKETGRGTGLGLAVVHGIIHGHGGAITCKSSPGMGTTFEIYLPEVLYEEEAGKHLEEKPIPRGTERILFVDDEPALVTLAERILSNLGYSVVTRTDSIEALNLFKEDPYSFDLVITDMTMPGMTGDRLAQNLMGIRKNIPIILCTGYSEHISEERAKKTGIREFFMKPFEIRVLAETIRKVLDGG